MGHERHRAAASHANRRKDRVVSSEPGPASFRDFAANWEALSTQIVSPDQAALHHGIARTDIPGRLDDLAAAVIAESTSTSDEVISGMGPCMEYLQKKEGTHCDILYTFQPIA